MQSCLMFSFLGTVSRVSSAYGSETGGTSASTSLANISGAFHDDSSADATSHWSERTEREWIRAETMLIYQQQYSEGMTPLETSSKILDDAKTFKTKTWLQQIYLGTDMARNNVRRRIQKCAQERISINAAMNSSVKGH